MPTSAILKTCAGVERLDLARPESLNRLEDAEDAHRRIDSFVSLLGVQTSCFFLFFLVFFAQNVSEDHFFCEFYETRRLIFLGFLR